MQAVSNESQVEIYLHGEVKIDCFNALFKNGNEWELLKQDLKTNKIRRRVQPFEFEYEGLYCYELSSMLEIILLI